MVPFCRFPYLKFGGSLPKLGIPSGGGTLTMRITVFCPHKFLDMFDKSWRFPHCLGSSIQRPRILSISIWGFPKIRGTFLGVPVLRILVFWGLYRGPLILGNYHMVQGRLSILRIDNMVWVSFPCMSYSLNSLKGVI